ncbi:MAG: FAD binding domain-containing protein [Candidatus Eisenbacteria bacterium]|nr:FAD binding domain-containing protein [Candidatus Eisenbacteria bacterium]
MTDAAIISVSTLNQALKAMAQKNVVALAGGTDVLVRLHDVVDRPWPRLLVLEGVKPLHRMTVKDDRILLGPLLTFADIAKSAGLRKFAPQLVEAASLAGSVLIRNRGTIGGNVAHASPAGDLIPPLFVLSARLELSSVNGKRYVSIEDFVKGPGLTALKANELITSIILEKCGSHGFYLRLAARRALAISKVSVAANLSVRREKVDRIKVALGAVAPTVVRALRTEDYLLGRELTDGTISVACSIAKNEATPITDIRSDAEYRRGMVAVLLRRGLARIAHTGTRA